MKPRIRYMRSIGAWAVVRPAFPAHAGLTSLHDTWPEALEAVGIRLPERWWQ